MQLTIIGKHFEVTPALKTHVTEKLTPFIDRFQHLTRGHVTLHKDHITHIAEGTLLINSYEIHAQAEAHDMYLAIDELTEKLLHQLSKYKEKLLDSHKNHD